MRRFWPRCCYHRLHRRLACALSDLDIRRKSIHQSQFQLKKSQERKFARRVQLIIALNPTVTPHKGGTRDQRHPRSSACHHSLSTSTDGFRRHGAAHRLKTTGSRVENAFTAVLIVCVVHIWRRRKRAREARWMKFCLEVGAWARAWCLRQTGFQDAPERRDASARVSHFWRPRCELQASFTAGLTTSRLLLHNTLVGLDCFRRIRVRL